MMTRCLFLIGTLALTLQSYGQSYWSYDDHSMSLKLPETSLVAVMPSNYNINLNLGLPQAAGAKPGENSDNTDDNTWLNYTCCLAPNSGNRKVYAQVTSGSIPDGINLELEVKDLQTAGKGNVGQRYSSTIYLSNQPQVVVYGIGGSCTYRGQNFGHQLIYTLSLKDIDDLALKEPKTYLTITYTISD